MLAEKKMDGKTTLSVIREKAFQRRVLNWKHCVTEAPGIQASLK